MRPIDADALVNNINERIENMTGVGVAIDAAYLWALIYDEINEAPTIEPSGDLISREDAIAYIDRVTNSGLGKYKSLDYIRNYISALPSADRPQVNSAEWVAEKEKEFDELHRPKGEWIRVTNGRGGHECSNCHAYAPSYMSGDEYLSDFCPNCGADMRLEK